MTDYRADFEFHRNTLEFEGSLNENTVSLDCKVAGREDKHYTHTQATPSNVWTIRHGLNKEPSVTVLDSAGTRITGFQADYVDLNTVVLYFNGGFAGTANFN